MNSMILWELKKIFKCKTGLIVFALFIFICGVMSFLKPTLETENPYRNDQYELVEDTRPKKEIADEKFNEKIKQIEQMANTYVNDNSINKIIVISRDHLRFMKCKEYKDVDFYKAMDHRVDHPFMSILMVIIFVLIFSNIYTDERVSGVDNIILSSKNKLKALYSKLALAIILPIVIYGLYLAMAFLVTVLQYGMPVNGGLEAFRIVDAGIFLKHAFTINGYLLLKIGTMTLVFMSIAVFSSFFSFISTNSLASISATLIFIGFGKVCTLIKFLPNSLLNIVTKGNYVDLLFYPDRFVGMYAGDVLILGKSLDLINLCNGILIGMIFIGVGISIFTFKKILTK
ncbi:hypothetical protein IZY60_09195 [Lutibacter sp. B2]|nr:hypothetical protein [Lutibacter sp. B2]